VILKVNTNVLEEYAATVIRVEVIRVKMKPEHIENVISPWIYNPASNLS
jgi:hypothetical protein